MMHRNWLISLFKRRLIANFIVAVTKLESTRTKNLVWNRLGSRWLVLLCSWSKFVTYWCEKWAIALKTTVVDLFQAAEVQELVTRYK